MFAGKTTELLKRVLWAQNGLSLPVAVFKPAFDKRYSVTDIASHDGLVAPATVIAAWNGVPAAAAHVFFDEVQFFAFPHFDGDIVSIIRALLTEGRDVTVAGLDSDWRGAAFVPTAILMAMADEIVKLSAHCAVCGRVAGKSYKRLTQAATDATIQLGGTELYEPRCRAHWSIAEEIEAVA